MIADLELERVNGISLLAVIRFKRDCEDHPDMKASPALLAVMQEVFDQTSMRLSPPAKMWVNRDTQSIERSK